MTLKTLNLFLIILFIASCGRDKNEIEYIIDEDQLNYEEALDVNMIYSDSAIIRVNITGPKMLRHLDKDNPRQEFPEGVKVMFYSPNRRSQSVLTAKHATRYDKTNQIHIKDSVVWLSNDGKKLETEELIWEERKERVFTNSFVIISKPDEVVYGHGFEANQDFTEWTINAVEIELSADKIKANN